MLQITYLGKLQKNEAWNSLSIPKDASKEFNDNKFSRGKHGGHYTDDLI